MKTAQDQLQSVVIHSGDCACWKPDCFICDCGALRRSVGSAAFSDGNHPIWDAWANHLAAIQQAIENPPFTKQEQRKLRVDQHGEPLDPQDTSNWEETTQP